MTDARSHIYFPGLNGLRFVASLLVLLHHIEQMKMLFGYPNAFQVGFVDLCGPLPVTAFFVLSGFLITYLLLDEKSRNGTINACRFYIRRALRILPLYYLTIFIGLVVLPLIPLFDLPNLSELVFNNGTSKIVMLLLLLPNIATVMYPAIPYVAHTWSIGVEEQFYLLLPQLLNRTKRYIPVAVTFIVAFVVVTNLVRLYPYHPTALKYVTDFFDQWRLSCMAIGGVGACLVLFKKQKLLDFLFRRDVQAINLLLLLVSFGFGIHFPIAHHEIYSLFFIVLILNQGVNKRPLFSLEGKVLHYLGSISYGLYMYHAVAVVLTMRLLTLWFGFAYSAVWENVVLYIICISVATILAALSYQFYELPFLRMKRRFAST